MKNDQMYLHPEVETLSRPDIEKLQLKRLKATIDRCMHSPFYKERFQQCGIKPEDIQSLEDLQKIPFTTKQDLRDHYPFGLSAVPLEEVVRLHSSSGTTGTPTVILHTQHDLEEWANAVARCLYMVGLRKGDIFQNLGIIGVLGRQERTVTAPRIEIFFRRNIIAADLSIFAKLSEFIGIGPAEMGTGGIYLVKLRQAAKTIVFAEALKIMGAFDRRGKASGIVVAHMHPCLINVGGTLERRIITFQHQDPLPPFSTAQCAV